MKKIIFFVAALLCSITGFAQENTKISVTVRNAKDSTLHIRKSIMGFNKKTDEEFDVKTGRFEFKFDIDRPTKIGLHINNKYITIPGVWDMLLEPNDDIHIAVPEMKTAGFFGFGIMNVDFSGRGSEKFNLLKSAIDPMYKILKGVPPLDKQSITYQYQKADRNLNIIDSAFQNYKGKVSQKAKDILKAQLYEGILDGLFISSLRSENDSLRFLFDKYIVNKKRIEVFFKEDVIYYEGGAQVVPNYIVLSEFNNPVYVGADSFRIKNRLSMAKMELKYVSDKPAVRDFLLSNQTLAHIQDKHYDPSVIALYQFYKTHADSNNPMFSKVQTAFEHAQNNLAPGAPFYNFSLPDTNGKMYRLADFKDKVLVFDFWFVGCGGCKQMAPVMEELEKEYEGKSIQFISVNADKKADWLKGIGKYCSKNSLQLYTEEQETKHPFIKYLNFSGYPHLVVVDKDGKMVGTPPDPRGDKESFRKFINKYL